MSAGTMPAGTMPAGVSAADSAVDTPATGGSSAAQGNDTAAAAATTAESPLGFRTFLLLDDAGNPVIMPGMTFEKLDELQRLQEGWQHLDQLYAIDSLQLQGRLDETAAELSATVRIDLEPTAAKWVTVPLRMGNFHLRGPVDVSGVEDYRLDLGPDGSGYLLHLRSQTRRQVVVSLRLVGRVTSQPTTTLEFRLPDAPSRVLLDYPAADRTVTVLGRGDEVLQNRMESDRTVTEITSGGGNFSVRFGVQLPVVDTRPVLEAESRLVIDWLQADSTATVSQELAVRSGRGDLQRFGLLVPPGLLLSSPPQIRSGAPFEIDDLGNLDKGDEGAARSLPDESNDDGSSEPTAAGGQRIDVVPLSDRGDSRVEIGIAGRWHTVDGRSGSEMIIRPVAVQDSMEQSGEIEVRIPRDYRLRWRPQPWISSLWDQLDSDAGATRTYRFHYERVPFELPVWLSARAKRLRVEGDYRLTFYDNVATLRLLLRTSGGLPDSRTLQVQVPTWRVQRVVVGGSTVPLDFEQRGDRLEIDLAARSAGSDSERLEITLVQSLEDSLDRIDLPLPQVLVDSDQIGTVASTLSVAAQADYRFVADLESSSGLGEVLRIAAPLPSAEPLVASGGQSPALPEPQLENRYALPDISQPCNLAGFLLSERPRIAYQAEADITLVGNQLVEEIRWVVYPQGGLRGRLPIAWGRAAAEDNSQSGGAVVKLGNDTAAESRFPVPPGQWTVTVDDSPATLRRDEPSGQSIYSDLLAAGPHRVRLRRSRELPAALFTDADSKSPWALQCVALPRPAVTDVTLRGPMALRLQAGGGRDLVWADPSGLPRGSSDEVVSLASPPLEILPLQLRSVHQRQEDVLVQRAIVRTALGGDVQQDDLLARVHGSGVLRLPLSLTSDQQLIRATLDGQPTEVEISPDGHAWLRIEQAGSYTVGLQIWTPRLTQSASSTLQPVLRLPVGTERYYWEVILPQDNHLVWASPSMGRAMRWQFDRWRLHRQPVLSAAELADWVGASWETRLPPGNRYLFVGVDASGLRAVAFSRMLIWMLGGSTVLLVGGLLSYVPAARHPLLAVAAAVALSGLMLLAPDAAVLAGQVMLIAILMVAVMTGVSYLLTPRRPRRSGAASSFDRSSVRAANRSRSELAPASDRAASGSAALPPETRNWEEPRPHGPAAEVRS